MFSTVSHVFPAFSAIATLTLAKSQEGFLASELH
jgi:hypothetical protein